MKEAWGAMFLCISLIFLAIYTTTPTVGWIKELLLLWGYVITFMVGAYLIISSIKEVKR